MIGEHIDYEGYSVLPMAIRQDTIVAIRKCEEGEGQRLLKIANVNSDKYSLCTYPADPEQVGDVYFLLSTYACFLPTEVFGLSILLNAALQISLC